ncbi:hypothetical protein CL621_04825 [archaeon]|nr:hypothetical protein [archaeon]
MYTIKQVPEDFYVKEIMDLDLKKSGTYTYFILKKRDWNTFDALKEISKRLNVGIKRFGYGGNKDKKAVTEQYISVWNLDKNSLNKIKIKDIEIKFVGYGDKRISLGDLNCNYFKIVVRNLEKKKELKINKVKNYFDEQRFGVEKKNSMIGKALVKKNFKKVCELCGLNIKGKDYVGSINNIDKKMLKFYVHSFQSELWNKIVKKLKHSYSKIPLLGFLTEFENKEIKDLSKKVLKEERISLKDFIIKQFLGLSMEGGMRDMFVKVDDFKYKYSKDNLNKGKFKVGLEFKLKSGSYATLIVKELSL